MIIMNILNSQTSDLCNLLEESLFIIPKFEFIFATSGVLS